MHQSISTVDWGLFPRNFCRTFRRITCIYVAGARTSPYIHTSWPRDSTTFPSSDALFAVTFPCRRAREQNVLFPCGARQVVQRLLSTTVSSSPIIFHDIACQLVYRFSPVDGERIHLTFTCQSKNGSAFKTYLQIYTLCACDMTRHNFLSYFYSLVPNVLNIFF